MENLKPTVLTSVFNQVSRGTGSEISMHDTAIDLHITVGASINNTWRVLVDESLGQTP